MSTVKKIINSYFKEYFKINISSAYYFGYQKYKYDQTIFDSNYIKKNKDLIAKYKKEVKKIKKDKLNVNDKIDYELFISHLIVSETNWKLNYHITDPSTYLPHQTIQTILFSGATDKKKMILARVPNMIKNIQIGMEIVDGPIEIWNNVAISTALSSEVFENVNKQFKLNKKEKELLDNLFEIAKEYAKHLKSLKTVKKYGIGKKEFSKLVKHSQHIDISVEKMFEFGMKSIKENTNEMKKIAKRNGKTLNQFMEEVEKFTVPKNKIVDEVKKILKEHRKFSKKIFDWKHKEKLNVIETPKSMREQFPTAVFFPPRLKDPKQIGTYNVTKPANKKVQGHMNIYQLRTVSAHEGYPGHHLQMSFSNSCTKKRNTIREFTNNIPLIEGWALYIEKLLVDIKYLDTDYDEFLMRAARLLRSCRVVIDIGTHCKGWSYQKAVNMLEKKALLPKTRALGEAFWYSQRPSYPLSYLMGATQIEKMRDEYFKNKSDNELKEYKKFHKNLLCHGNIPLKFIKLLMK